MDSPHLAMHVPFGLAAVGLLVLDLSEPSWWPSGLGWVALVVVLVCWVAYSRGARKRR